MGSSESRDDDSVGAAAGDTSDIPSPDWILFVAGVAISDIVGVCVLSIEELDGTAVDGNSEVVSEIEGASDSVVIAVGGIASVLV